MNLPVHNTSYKQFYLDLALICSAICSNVESVSLISVPECRSFVACSWPRRKRGGKAIGARGIGAGAPVPYAPFSSVASLCVRARNRGLELLRSRTLPRFKRIHREVVLLNKQRHDRVITEEHVRFVVDAQLGAFWS